MFFALTKKKSQAKTSEEALNTQLRSVELDLEKTRAQAVSFQERKTELENAFNKAKEHTESLAKAAHTADTEKQTAITELKAIQSSVSDLKVRLDSAQNETIAVRDALDKEKRVRSDLGETCKKYEVTADQAQKSIEELKGLLQERESELKSTISRYQSLLADHTELKTSLNEREAGHAKQLVQFEEQKAALKEQFEVLANQILDSKTKILQNNSTVSMKSIMDPFKETLNGFKKEVQDIHNRETAQRSELRKELEHLQELNKKITTEAHELSTALRGQKKLQGNWGELVLENVLDRSGLQLGKDYKREVSFTTEGGRQRPDAIVYLPQGKHLIIDSKVSLNAYTRFVNSEDDVERQIALDEHVSAVRARIKELTDKDYYKISELNSPEMVFMFVPIESAFVEALKADETLFQSAIEHNVLVATPTTLLTSLNIVRQLWRFEEQNKHTAALAEKAEGVFNKLRTFLGSFEKVKKGLEAANASYLSAEGQLVDGPGNLVKRVNDFRELAPGIKAELPAYYTNKAELELLKGGPDLDVQKTVDSRPIPV